MEAFPDRVIHFVLDFHSLQGDLNEIDWNFFEEENFLTVADVFHEDPWAILEPAIHMQAEYDEVRDHLGIIAFRDGCSDGA